MTAEIISVGTELLLGNILNTNAQFLSQELAALGITVQRQSTIGDNHDRLAEWVEAAKARADLLVFTGGLGPTADDLTKETVAACYGDSLTFDPEEWEKITSFFARMGRQTTPNNRKQAMVPVHGQKIPNAHGTAPGAWFEQEGRCAVLMPGVPAEMKAMWAEQVRPRLLARQNCTLHSLTLRVLGGESDIEYRVRGLLKNENPTAAIYCKTGESEIRITARAASDQDGAQMCRAYAKKFYDLLGDAVYDEDVPGLAHTVVHTLAARGLTLSTAESCTGGMIAQQLTGVPGASDVFGYGFVTYWEQAKARLLGVDPAVIERYNVVSGPVAAQMARGALTDLLENGVSCEFADQSRVVLILTPFHTAKELLRIEDWLRRFRPRPPLAQEKYAWGAVRQAMTPREALFAAGKRLAVEKAAGKVALEALCPCPPGIPVVLPGEILSADAAEALKNSGIFEIKVL